MKKYATLLAVIILAFLVTALPLSAVDLKESLRQRIQDSSAMENQLLQDILLLNTRIQVTSSDIQELERQIIEVQEQLGEARIRLVHIEEKLLSARDDLNLSLRFLYTNKPSSFLTTVAVEANWFDVLIQWELLMYLTDYFYDKVRRSMDLQARVREENRLIAEKEKTLRQAHEELAASKNRLVSLKLEKEETLAELRQQNSALAMDLIALEQSWSGALPLLHYMLQQLPSLPWKTLKPDKVDLDLTRGKVLATFSESNLNETLLSSPETADKVWFRFTNNNILILGQDFQIVGNLQVAGPHRILFTPQSVSFGGFPLAHSTWKELLGQDTVQVDLPPPDFGLKFNSLSLESGRMLLVLSR